MPMRLPAMGADSATDQSTIVRESVTRLDEIATQAQEEGFTAHSHVVVGKSWLAV